jgi:RNA polymerase sigma-70 factor (ECF subfamily)
LKEANLIKRCKKRNARAQRLMVERYSNLLFSVCCRYVKDRDFAKDCLQESWIQIFWNLDKYKEEGKWEPWITKVTINKCKEMLRKMGKWKIEELDADLVVEELNREEVIINEETVEHFLNQLPQRYRMVVNLYLVEGYNHGEIAEFLEITESSSRSLLSRAKQMLKEAFREPEENTTIESRKFELLRKTIYKKAII